MGAGSSLGGPAARLVYRPLVDGGMVYDPRGQTVHHLNQSAACVWEACQRGEGREQMAAALCARFEVEARRARADVDALLARFAAAGLLEP